MLERRVYELLWFLPSLELEAISYEQCTFTSCCRRLEMLSSPEFGVPFACFPRSLHVSTCLHRFEIQDLMKGVL